uniref:Putative secreted protein n=1 Tax=Anopheles marajoara TaxID=58244 RepID=A0A2M4CDS6_9DIPT
MRFSGSSSSALVWPVLARQHPVRGVGKVQNVTHYWTSVSTGEDSSRYRMDLDVVTRLCTFAFRSHISSAAVA